MTCDIDTHTLLHSPNGLRLIVAAVFPQRRKSCVWGSGLFLFSQRDYFAGPLLLLVLKAAL